ncbi:MAG: ribbon-helix-helix protein, CopG family [Eubacterium sp.]|nr:ribbon-helix-helix protein, CopG family [Eubacterium sp.]
MALKAVNFKLDEAQIEEMKRVAEMLRMNYTDVVREAIAEYIERMRKDPYYRLTAAVEEADPEESSEILDAVNGMSDEDMKISRVEKVVLTDADKGGGEDE